METVDPSIFIKAKEEDISLQYNFIGKISEGEYSTINLVKNTSTGMEMIMKRLKKKNLPQSIKDQLINEFLILKKIDHPNIVKIHEMYSDDVCYYLIFEYLNGGELFNRIIKNKETFTENNIRNIMKQILSAIVYCHSKNIVHRDIKPEHIIFDSAKPDASIKIIDFGLSKNFNKNSLLHEKAGSVFLSQNYNEKCDVWSCGIIMYVLFCGYPPFHGANEDATLLAIQKKQLIFGEEWSKVSKEAIDLITNMLNRNVEKRFTALEALSHQWFKNTNDNKLDQTVLKNIHNFQSNNVLKCTILTYIANNLLQQTEKENLIKEFNKLDKNGDGFLSKGELIEGYLQVCPTKYIVEGYVDKIFKELDTNNSGKIEWTEFVIAATDIDKLFSVEKIEKAFNYFDTVE